MSDREDQPTNTPTLTCPWCGIADVAVESEQVVDRIVTGFDENNGPVYWAECQRCGARSSLVGWAADAIQKWNTRAPALAPGVGVTEEMVERALAAYHEGRWPDPFGKGPHQRRMRTALTAALGGGTGEG